MAHAVHDHAPAPAEADLQLDLVAVRVFAHTAARRDGLVAHREVVVAGVSFGSAWPLAGTGCQNDAPSVGWITVARPRTVSAELIVVYPLPSILAHVSRSPTVRLRIRRAGVDSRRSTQK